MSAGSIFACSSISRTSGRISRSANSYTLSRNNRSSSDSVVRACAAASVCCVVTISSRPDVIIADMRRLVVALLLGAAIYRAEARQQPPREGAQPPIFRGGTTLVQVDAIVADSSGQPLVDLAAGDFVVLDDGRPVPLQSVRFLGAETYSGDPTLAPIRTHDDEEREASRDDVRVYAIFLDDYHVQRFGELRVIEPLLAFVRQLPPTDLVAVY